MPTRCSASPSGTRTGPPTVSDAFRFAYRSRRLLLPVQQTGPCSATVPVADPCRVTAAGFAARRCRHELRLFPAPVTIIFPPESATSASTVPVSVTRAASGISTCSTTNRKKFPAKVATTNRFPVRSVGRSGLNHRREFLLVPLPVGATVALSVRELHRVACRSRSRVATASPLNRRSGSIPSLCRDPESFAVCSSIFSHFYARRRFLSHPTQEIAVGHACSPSCKMMETCSESMT